MVHLLFLDAVTDSLPPEAKGFLSNYGVWLGAGLAGLLLLLILARLLRGGRRRPHPESGLRENLAEYPPPPAPGELQLLIDGLPVRVRLVVVAPVGKPANWDRNAIEPMLDQVVRGLSVVVRQDKPRFRFWPPQLSQQGFAPTFHRLTAIPDGKGRASRWVLAAGTARIGKQPILLGLALMADDVNEMGLIMLSENDWTNMLRVQ